ncbi:cell surface glycoprotein (s-layer protein) [Methanothermobacter thermautotrophicus str. Delta H]|uniref:Cell surface glycoprotein (S-layer protein) n=2 Tax=Methanothermobacter thermautotrophicus TaxID=145262 RepID=O26815_METTH|nr:cell surface glycoprotein (s-layer protein) [Methanothermobacter thermautotrophicus str. Delta H]
MVKIMSRISFLLLVLAVAFLLVNGVSATVVNLNTTEEFSTIQEAIDNSTDGHHLIVNSGTYNENVLVNKTLTLEANGTVTVSAGNTTMPVFNVTANNTQVKGFTITGGKPGIYLSGSNNTICNNVITSNGEEGIYLLGSDNNTICNNTITNNQWGIYLFESGNNTICNNTITNNSYGIFLFGSGNNTIVGNYFINNTNQTAGDLSGNYWNGTEVGNYWSDYAGDDLDGDGIGDTPYNLDQKPLIVDLMIENISTSGGIQVRVKNNGKADITRIDPNAQVPITVQYNSQEFTRDIDPLPGGGTQTITLNIVPGGNYQIITTILYNETTHYLETTTIRDANTSNNIKKINITAGNLKVTPTSGVAPLNIKVSADLTNTGDLPGNYTAGLIVNGRRVATKTVEVPAGGVVVVSFNYTLTSAGNYTLAINNLTAFASVKISVRQLTDAASWVRAYYGRYGRLPGKVTISGHGYSMAQFLYLLCRATVNINAGNVAPISVKSVASAPASGGWYRHGRLYRSSYVRVAKNILSFIDSRGRAPNYAITGLGRIPFQRLVYMYSKIIKFYGTNKRLPNYVTI